MAAATPPWTTSRFCGRCGAQLQPGAAACWRCGTPVAQQAVAAMPAYRYPAASRSAYPTTRQFKLAPIAIAGGLLLILAIVTIVISAFAVSRFSGGTHSTCVVNCAPKIVTPLPEEASFRSAAYKFQVNYGANWTIRTQDANGVTLATKLGYVQVTGMSGGSPDQVLQETVSTLPTAQWQGVTLVNNLRGAHIGDQDGVGAIYSANLVGPSSTAAKVRFAVIVASQRGVTVVIFAVDPAIPKSYPNGMPEGPAFDYLCTEFAWG